MDRKLGATVLAEGPALVSGNLANGWIDLVGPSAASIVAGLPWRSVGAERIEA